MDNIEKKQKLSKYNFHTRNDDGELLLFNSYAGTDSLLKISKSDSKMIESCFNDLKIKFKIPVYKLGNDNDMTDVANGIAEFFAT